MNTIPFVGLIRSAVSNKEGFDNSYLSLKEKIQYFLAIALGIFAGYVSWQSNASMGEGRFDIFLRSVYAFFAFLFGLIYIIGKAILNSESREIIMRPFRVVIDRVRGKSAESAYPETSY